MGWAVTHELLSEGIFVGRLGFVICPTGFGCGQTVYYGRSVWESRDKWLICLEGLLYARQRIVGFNYSKLYNNPLKETFFIL